MHSKYNICILFLKLLFVESAKFSGHFFYVLESYCNKKKNIFLVVSLFWKQNGHHITSLMPNRRVIMSKRPYISLIIVSRASKYQNYL